jgi:hypothetical protein
MPQSKAAQIKFRLAGELNARIEQAAMEHGWGVSEEIRRRLEASFANDPANADQKTAAFLSAVAKIAHNLGVFYEPWHQSAYSLAVLKSSVTALLTVMGPKGEPKLQLDPERHMLDAIVDTADPPETVGRLLAMMELTGYAEGQP